MEPVAPPQDLGTLRTWIAAEAPFVDMSRAHLAHAADNVVVETPDWIIRFPIDPAHDLQREVAVLRHVAGSLPVATPQVAWVGRRTRCLAYPRLTGASFSPADYVTADEAARDRLAGSIATAVAGLHAAFTSADMDSLQLPRVDYRFTFDRALESREHLKPRERAAVDGLLDAFAGAFLDREPGDEVVVLHNDVQLDNAVLTAPVGTLAGLWDFSGVGVGAPTWDLRYLASELSRPGDQHRLAPDDLGVVPFDDMLRRVARRYTRLTGRDVDRSAAVVAGRVEVLAELAPAQVGPVLRAWAELDERTERG